MRLRMKNNELIFFFFCDLNLTVCSWCKGASIGWHSDDNRPYLKQRDFAVCGDLFLCSSFFDELSFPFSSNSSYFSNL